MRPRLTTLARLLAPATVAAAGCHGCREKPYVPYHVETDAGVSASASGAVVATPPSGSVEGGTFPHVAGVAAPAGATTWSLGGLPLTAPAGRIFIAGLPLTVPAGQPPAVAVFVGDGGSLAGEVMLYRGGPGGRPPAALTLGRVPTWLTGGPGCNHVVSLAQVGPSTLWADVSVPCDGGDPKRPTRWLAALSTSNATPLRLELRALAAPLGDTARFEADGGDSDGDGNDDLLVKVTLASATNADAHATVPVRFLDRSGGLSYQPGEPRPTFEAETKALREASVKKATAAAALGESVYLRRLHAFLCAEGGSPALTRAEGSPLGCDAQRVLDELEFVEGRAVLTLDDPARAFAVSARIARQQPKSRLAEDLDKLVGASRGVTVVAAKARPLKTQPLGASVALPLAFEPNGALLIAASDGVVRVDPVTFEEAPVAGAAPWSSTAALLGDLRVDRVTDTCQAAPLALHITSASAGDRAWPLGAAGGSLPHCNPGAPTPLALLDRNGEGLTLLAQGEPVSVSADGEKVMPAAWPAGPGARGSARSPSGAWAAVPGVDHVFVRGNGRTHQLWRPQPRFVFGACTVADDARAVACLLENGAVLLTP